MISSKAYFRSNATSCYPEQYEKVMKTNHAGNKNLYCGFNATQALLIQSYLVMLTLEKYKQFKKGDLRLTVDPHKVANMRALTNNQLNWSFGGVLDMQYVAGTCALGHPLRYAYLAVSETAHAGIGKLYGVVRHGGADIYLTQGRDVLVFGSTCVSDFFQMDSALVDLLKRVKSGGIEELKAVAYMQYSGKMYPDFDDKCTKWFNSCFSYFAQKLEQEHKAEYDLTMRFIQANVPLPPSLYYNLVRYLETYEYLTNASKSKKASESVVASEFDIKACLSNSSDISCVQKVVFAFNSYKNIISFIDIDKENKIVTAGIADCNKQYKDDDKLMQCLVQVKANCMNTPKCISYIFTYQDFLHNAMCKKLFKGFEYSDICSMYADYKSKKTYTGSRYADIKRFLGVTNLLRDTEYLCGKKCFGGKSELTRWQLEAYTRDISTALMFYYLYRKLNADG